jgi:hypothetical protein
MSDPERKRALKQSHLILAALILALIAIAALAS